MELNEYQQAALKTAGDLADANEQETLLYIATTLSGETGELANYVKKVVWHRHPFVLSMLVDELGDILWYVARSADLLGVPLEDVAALTLRKLQNRYPKGFSSEASILREV